MTDNLEDFSWHLASEFSEHMPERLRSAGADDRFVDLVRIDLSRKQIYREIQEFIQNVLDIRRLLQAMDRGATEVRLKHLIFQRLSGLSEEDISEPRECLTHELAKAGAHLKSLENAWRESTLRMVEAHAPQEFECFLKLNKIPDKIGARRGAAFRFEPSREWPVDDPLVEAATKASQDALAYSNFVGTLRKRLELWTARWGWPDLWYSHGKEIKAILYEATLQYRREQVAMQRLGRVTDSSRRRFDKPAAKLSVDPNPANRADFVRRITRENPHLRGKNLDQHTCAELDALPPSLRIQIPERWRTDFHVDTWSEAYKNTDCLKLLRPMFSKDRSNR